MNYTIYCCFLLSLFASIFILNIKISFAHIPNYSCFSLSRGSMEKGYKLVGVNKPWENLWTMSPNNSFEIMDKAEKNSLLIKTTGTYQRVCTKYITVYDGYDLYSKCVQSKKVWTAHIVAVQAGRGDGLSIQGCGTASDPFRYMDDLPCCKLSINSRK